MMVSPVPTYQGLGKLPLIFLICFALEGDVGETRPTPDWDIGEEALGGGGSCDDKQEPATSLPPSIAVGRFFL